MSSSPILHVFLSWQKLDCTFLSPRQLVSKNASQFISNLHNDFPITVISKSSTLYALQKANNDKITFFLFIPFYIKW